MGTWRLTTDGVTFYPAFDIKVMKQISGLNMIQKVSSIGSGYTNDTVVRLMDPNNIEVFRGYITRVAPPEDDEDIVEDFEVQEMAKELKDTMITDGIDYSVIWASSANIDLILEAMLGYSSPTWTHPDSDTTSLGTDITFESMSMLDGIYKICRQMRGHIVWFDGVNRNVRFGSSRTDRTGTPITSWIKKKTVIDTAMSNVDEVVVYGTDRSVSGSYGTSSGITKAYQVLSLVNSIECTNVATQIFNQLSVPKKQIRVLMEYNDIYDEGDLVRVGVDTTDYVIHEVVLSENETWLGLNSATESIFDAQPMVGVSEGSGDDTENVMNTITNSSTGGAFTSFVTWLTDAFNGDNDAVGMNDITVGSCTEGGDLRTGIWSDA